MHSLIECTLLVNIRQMYTIHQSTMYHKKKPHRPFLTKRNNENKNGEEQI